MKMAAPIAASTAVHNSARFTYISPSGKFAENNHIIDGGYFENYGAESALELIRAVRTATQKRDQPLKIAVIQIVSDPDLSREVLMSATTSQPNTAATMPNLASRKITTAVCNVVAPRVMALFL